MDNETGIGNQPMVRYPGLPSLVAVWSIVAVLSYTRHYLQQAHAGAPIPFWRELFAWVTCSYAWVFLTPLLFRLERRFPLRSRERPWSILVLALASVPACYTAYLVTAVLTLVVRALQGAPYSLGYESLQIPPVEFCIEQFLYWSVIAAGWIIRKLMLLEERQRESARLAFEKTQMEAALKQAELEVLRMRLNPHFLFNSLQNISVLIQQDPKGASRMLARLGDLLRPAFRREYQPEVALEKEIALTRAYLEIEQIRFGPRLHVRVDVADDTAHALVPSLLLQPLVENAIVHGLQGVSERGIIGIRTIKNNGRLVITIADNGSGPPADTLSELEVGVGLGSTRERLERMYPGMHEFTVQPVIGGGTEVRIAIPFRTAPVDSKCTEADEELSSAHSR